MAETRMTFGANYMVSVPIRCTVKHIPSGWNQPDGMCPVKRASPVRAIPIRWNRERFHLIGIRSNRQRLPIFCPGTPRRRQGMREHGSRLKANKSFAGHPTQA
jgi:hypothetical protein